LNDNIQFTQKRAEKVGGFSVNQKTAMWELPICNIDFSNPVEKAQHDKLVALGDNMLELQKKHRDARRKKIKSFMSGR